MKPAPFDYVAPSSLEAVLAILAAHGSEAKLLAGGQSLIPVMNFRLARPAQLVDLNRVRELDYLRSDGDGGLRIGAMTRQRRLERDPLVAQCAPLVHEAIPHVAHPQIRNRGTLGGSLAHADPAAELPAVTVALDARFLLRRAGGERWVPAREFFAGPFTTVMEPGEILVEVAVPPLPPDAGCAFLEIARRHGDYAQIGVAAVVRLDEDGRCREARLVYLSAGDVPVDAQQAASLLAGEWPSAQAVEAAAVTAAEREIEPLDDIHASARFKRHLARALTVRALTRAVERARPDPGAREA